MSDGPTQGDGAACPIAPVHMRQPRYWTAWIIQVVSRLCIAHLRHAIALAEQRLALATARADLGFAQAELEAQAHRCRIARYRSVIASLEG